jgi:pimeloyl-ACP methyl ester carboxylesterase
MGAADATRPRLGTLGVHAAVGGLIPGTRAELNVHPPRQRLRLSGGTELPFITAGEPSKPAVLLLHGFPASARNFRDVVPELSRLAGSQRFGS